MLPPALINAADRLITTLMTLVDAVSPIALAGSTPTFPNHAAQTLFFRLAHLVATLIRISNFGIRAPAKQTVKPTTPAPVDSKPAAQRTQPGPTQSLPRHSGWLLAALPDIAPAIAADLDALLADPALTALLAAAPTLHRTLRPLLRSLGLPAAPPPSDPSPNAPPSPPPNARPIASDPAAPQSQPPPLQAAASKPTSQPMPLYVQIVAIS